MRPDADDELELLERWRGGDQDAGRRLFEGNFPALFGFFRRRFPDGAEDLTQRTLLLCVEGQGRQRAGSTFRAFLFGIARNVALQEIEARARQRRDDRDPAEVAEGGARPSEHMAQRADRRRLLRALRGLPVNDQILLELYHWEGLTGPELAHVLGVPEAALRSRIRRAVERLRAAIAASGADLGDGSSADFDAWVRSIRGRVDGGE